MKRSYDSSHRRRQALETRRRILDAAVELHGRGVTELAPLAEAAGVALPTVRKHFPTKEHVFEGCTAHFLERFTPPDLAGAAALAEPRARVERVARELAAAHEATHDLMWHAYPEAAGSPALSAALAHYAQLVDAAVAVALGDAGDDPRARARLRAVLDTLTYRALRVHAGLDVEAAREELTVLALAAVGPAPAP